MDKNGKPKAEDVTAPGGGNCTGPKKTRRRRKKKNGDEDGEAAAEGENGKEKTTAAKKQPQPHWHETLTDEVKAGLDAKEIPRNTGTLDVASGSARIKLGTKGYTSLAHANGILAEGTFECDADGKVSFTWERALAFNDGEWTAGDATASELPTSVSLVDGECILHVVYFPSVPFNQCICIIYILTLITLYAHQIQMESAKLLLMRLLKVCGAKANPIQRMRLLATAS